MSRVRFAPLLMMLLAAAAWAQHQHAPAGPYAGLDQRSIKALSDEQIADLRTGRGMGLALAAELNGYPGPIHVLEHAHALTLSPDQRTRVQALYDAMRAEAVQLGIRLIEQEAELDRQFARRTVTAASLERATAEIGSTQAALRATHLKYHLAMMDVLTAAQISRYGELRGYGTHSAKPGHTEHGRHETK